MEKIAYDKFEQIIGYRFNNKKLLNLAFTHSSFANENKIENNERLEFLGDAVLELVISHYIYKKFPYMPEGELTKLRASVVCEPMLATQARKLKFGDCLKLGKGEEISGGRQRDSILADTFEAVIGAVYLDSGIESVTGFIIDIMLNDISKMENRFKTVDCKTYLQEMIQKTSKEAIEYSIIDEQGPDHDKVFISEVIHKGSILGKGVGRSKKEAEQSAALMALERLGY